MPCPEFDSTPSPLPGTAGSDLLSTTRRVPKPKETNKKRHSPCHLAVGWGFPVKLCSQSRSSQGWWQPECSQPCEHSPACREIGFFCLDGGGPGALECCVVALGAPREPAGDPRTREEHSLGHPLEALMRSVLRTLWTWRRGHGTAPRLRMLLPWAWLGSHQSAAPWPVCVVPCSWQLSVSAYDREGVWASLTWHRGQRRRPCALRPVSELLLWLLALSTLTLFCLRCLYVAQLGIKWIQIKPLLITNHEFIFKNWECYCM